MNTAEELTFIKIGNRWEVTDKKGNKATGLTKQRAENQYRALYQCGFTPQGINLDQIKYFS